MSHLLTISLALNNLAHKTEFSMIFVPTWLKSLFLEPYDLNKGAQMTGHLEDIEMVQLRGSQHVFSKN